MITIIPALVALIGAVVYGVTDGRASELGRIAYAFGLLVTLLGLAGRAVRLF